MRDKKKWYRELEEARIWISDFFRDFGIALIAGSLMASAIDYRYWYSLIFGLLFLHISTSFKFGKRKKMTEEKMRQAFRYVNQVILAETFFLAIIGIFLYFLHFESFLFFLIFFGVWIYSLRKFIKFAIREIVKSTR
jgi:hypothetical protein